MGLSENRVPQRLIEAVHRLTKTAIAWINTGNQNNIQPT
jgi:hypothetical protein